MGADLYITKLDKTRTHGGFEVSKEARNDGYFRDCYNGGGVFSVMSTNVSGANLSWWTTANRKELFRKDGTMSIKGAKQFLAELTPIVEKFVTLNKLYYSDYNCEKKCHEKGKPIDDKDVSFYHKWAQGLLEFLQLAINLKSSIIWSV